MRWLSWELVWWVLLLGPAILNWLSLMRARWARAAYKRAAEDLRCVLAEMPQFQHPGGTTIDVTLARGSDDERLARIFHDWPGHDDRTPWELKPNPSGTLAREYRRPATGWTDPT